MARYLLFGTILNGPGNNLNAWRHPAGPADASVNVRYYISQARKAEAAGFAFAFLADDLNVGRETAPNFVQRMEPLTLIGALAASTERIGFVGTASTTYSEPFTLARQFATLELISGGRTGWNVVTSSLETTGANYSRAHPDHARRYEIAGEFVEVVKGLWDSFDDGAIVRDRETARFCDWSRVHALGHKGRFFQVAGPLNAPRSPQGQPVIVQAGTSEAGIHLAGQHAEAVFILTDRLEDMCAQTARIKEAAVAAGRDRDAVKVFPGISPIVGRTQQEAEAKYHAIRDLLTLDQALGFLGRYFDHHDFRQYDPDAPFPDIGDIGKNTFRTFTDEIKRKAREDNQTLRQVAMRVAAPRPSFIGTGETIADQIIEWFDAGAGDGFMLTFSVSAEGLEDFTRLVVPALEARGRYSRSYRGRTLRDHLGLPFKESRYRAPAPAEREEEVAP